MTLSIGSNSSSLRVQRSLSQVTDRLSTSLERLSSGQRINHASDDAAGLAVADRLRTDVRLHTAAVRNVNDAISAVAIIDSALSGQVSIIDRLSELAEQSANGTYSSKQRVALSSEYRSLLDEFGRIGSTTSFNGLNLLSSRRRGNPSELSLQAGINGSRNSILTLTTGDTTSYSGTVVIGSSDMSGPYTLAELTQRIEGQMGTATVTDSAGKQRHIAFGFSINNADNGQVQFSIWDMDAYAANPNTAQNPLFLTALDFADSTAGTIDNISAPFNFADGKSATLKADFEALRLSQDLGHFTGIASIGETDALDFTAVVDQITARTALTVLARKSSSLETLRGSFGALSSRLQVAGNLAGQSRVTESAAESRIRDADIGEESASVVASSILQKVASAVLAQANQIPSLAIKLLNTRP